MSNTALAVANNEKPIVVDELVFDQGVYGLYERAKIRPSPDNRKRFNEPALHELAASIKAMGVAQAILIRPVTPTPEAPEEYEIVAGERRWRASGIAGLTHIPALCRRLSDLDAAKIRILENLQREDPHPMEEAEGYQLLMLQHGFTADQLVDEVKKSRAYIYGRLKLCALTPDVREMFLDDKLSASTALLVARIPVPALQVKATQEILTPDWQGNTMSHRAAANHIQNRYMLKLGAATFSLTDAKLLASAGSCVKCPKRAGNQPEVFEGIDPNVCTDPDCFAEKKAAHAAALLVQANKKGIPVLEGEEGEAVMRNRWRSDSDLVTVDMGLMYFSRNAPATQNNGNVSSYLNDEALPPVASYRKTSDGTLTALYKRADIQAALERAGACETVEEHRVRMQAIAENPDLAPAKTAAQLKQEQQQQEHAAARAQMEKESAFRLALYKQLRQRASTAGLSLPSLREYVRALHDDKGLSSDVHDLYDFDVSTDLDNFIDHADANALQLLLLDMMLGDRLDTTWWHGAADDDEFAPIMAMARHEGIDVDAVRAEIFPPAPATPGTTEQAGADTDSGVVRYRHPDHPTSTWSGRGRQPKWVREWIEGGKSLDDLRVDAAPATADQTDADQLPAEAAPAAADQPNVEQPNEAPTSDEHVDGTVTPSVPPTADAQDDGDLLAEQLAEVTPTAADEGVQTSALDKKTKSRPAPAKKTATTSNKKASAKAPAKVKS
jgi:ParB/RepB/Spo0J family partition protein